jgi:hypothetical protein
MTWIIAICAAIPAVMFLRNLSAYRRLPRNGSAKAPPSERRVALPRDREQSRVSVLIPARNEEGSIRAAVKSALANGNCEVLVGDDHSTDRTAEIARAAGAKVISIPDLPAGWCGKQHACAVLARHATHSLLVFVDADVRLAPDALGRIAAFMDGCDLASGIPRQETETLFEKLLIPLIHFVLLGFLPVRRMRASLDPAFGAGCGQLFMARREAYEKCGGHGAIRATLHDGVKLPRAFRQAGFITDLFDATDIATCRMYRSAGEVWRGLAKNATEGLGAPATIVPATVMLLAGVVMLPVTYVPRFIAARRFRQSWLGAVLHPVGVIVLLAIQWIALARLWLGRPAAWKGRAYATATASLLMVAPVFGETSLAASIELKDQYEKSHVISFPRGKLSVLTIADRKGSAQLEAWVQPIREKFGEQIEIHGLADVAGVPGPIRPMVREYFREKVEYPVMLDWDGAVAARYGYVRKAALVLVIDRNGEIRHRVTGAADAAKLARVYEALR